VSGQKETSRDRGRSLALAELIDLEIQLQRDDERALEWLDERDRPIAEELASRGLEGREAARAWLERVRNPKESPGEQLRDLRELTSISLFATGSVIGVLTIGGWLLHGTGSPVNVVRFWPTVIGSQLLLLVGWGVLALPHAWIRWLPGLPAAQRLLGGIALAAPWGVARMLTRFTSRDRELTERSLGELRRLSQLYGRLRLWIVTGLTQSFAVGFNLGALAAFVVIPTIDDPAFGWRSTLMDAPEVHRAAEWIATPWEALVPRALPSLEQVRATGYSSVAARYASELTPANRTPEIWASWWPFLVASLLVYGLTPRLLLFLTAKLGLRLELRRAPRQHASYLELHERLQLLAFDSRARSPAESRLPLPEGGASATGRWSSLPSGPAFVLCWVGVPAADDALSRTLVARGVDVRGLVRVGGLEPGQDARALEALANAGSPQPSVCLVVEAWEPPVGDYIDFVRGLRTTLGDEVSLWVILYEFESSSPHSPSARAEQWRDRLRTLGDPWLHVCLWPNDTPVPHDARAKATP